MKIFQKVHCMAYLKKHSDGVALSCSVVDRSGAFEMPVQGSSWKEPIKVIATNIKPKIANNIFNSISILLNLFFCFFEKLFFGDFL